MVKGVEFIVDDEGKKKAVLIDLKKYGEVWEDFYDTLRVKAQESEPRESLKEVKKKVLGRIVKFNSRHIVAFSRLEPVLEKLNP